MKIQSFETAYRWWITPKVCSGQTFVTHKKKELEEALIAASKEIENLRNKYEGKNFRITEYFYDSTSLFKIFWTRDFTDEEKKNIAEAKKKYKLDALENEKRSVKKRAKQLGLL